LAVDRPGEHQVRGIRASDCVQKARSSQEHPEQSGLVILIGLPHWLEKWSDRLEEIAGIGRPDGAEFCLSLGKSDARLEPDHGIHPLEIRPMNG